MGRIFAVSLIELTLNCSVLSGIDDKLQQQAFVWLFAPRQFMLYNHGKGSFFLVVNKVCNFIALHCALPQCLSSLQTSPEQAVICTDAPFTSSGLCIFTASFFLPALFRPTDISSVTLEHSSDLRAAQKLAVNKILRKNWWISQPINQKHGQSIFSAGCIFISPLLNEGLSKSVGEWGVDLRLQPRKPSRRLPQGFAASCGQQGRAMSIGNEKRSKADGYVRVCMYVKKQKQAAFWVLLSSRPSLSHSIPSLSIPLPKSPMSSTASVSAKEPKIWQIPQFSSQRLTAASD